MSDLTVFAAFVVGYLVLPDAAYPFLIVTGVLLLLGGRLAHVRGRR